MNIFYLYSLVQDLHRATTITGLWRDEGMIMIMGGPGYPLSRARKRSRLSEIGRILLSRHQHREVGLV